jgi:hypothetical protein
MVEEQSESGLQEIPDLAFRDGPINSSGSSPIYVRGNWVE